MRLTAVLVSKDSIKEALADAVDADLPTGALGGLALDALWRIVRMLPGRVVVESFWFSGRYDRYFLAGVESVGALSGVEVWCHAPVEVLRRRYTTRERHRVHSDADRLAEWEEFAALAAPISDYPVVRVDTDSRVDVAATAAVISRTLARLEPAQSRNEQ